MGATIPNKLNEFFNHHKQHQKMWGSNTVQWWCHVVFLWRHVVLWWRHAANGDERLNAQKPIREKSDITGRFLSTRNWWWRHDDVRVEPLSYGGWRSLPASAHDSPEAVTWRTGCLIRRRGEQCCRPTVGGQLSLVSVPLPVQPAMFLITKFYRH